MATRPRRTHHTGATEAEWKWLTAAADCNEFFGFTSGRPGHATSLSRLEELWAEHQAEIREMWRKNPPTDLPPKHPVEAELPAELQGHARPDPRPTLADEDPEALEEHRQRVRAWEEARREWFRKHTHHSTEDER